MSVAILVFGAGGSFIAGGDLKSLHERRDAMTAKEMSSVMRQALAVCEHSQVS